MENVSIFSARSGHATELIHPQAVMDAGGEAGNVLALAMYRRIGEMSEGQILHVISLEPAARDDVVGWCMQTGHALLNVIQEGDETRYWIQKTRVL